MSFHNHNITNPKSLQRSYHNHNTLDKYDDETYENKDHNNNRN